MGVPWLGFTPDVDPTTPGAILDGENFVGDELGIRSEKTFEGVAGGDFTIPDDAFHGIAVSSLLMFVSTVTGVHKIDRVSSTSVTVTDVTPASYSPDGVSGHRFTRFGDYIIMHSQNRGYWWQHLVSTTWTEQTDALGHVLVQFPHDDFMVAGHKEWRTSDARVPTNYTIGAPSLAEGGTFPDTAGVFTGGKSLGPYAVLYKSTMIRLGRPAGAGINWSWEKVPSDDGVYAPGSLVSTSDAHYYIGRNNIFRFDGGRPVAIGSPVKRWLKARLSRIFYLRVKGVYDATNDIIYWFFNGEDNVAGSARYTEALSLHIDSGRFGRLKCSVNAIIDGADIEPWLDSQGVLTGSGIIEDSPTIFAIDTLGKLVALTGQADTSRIKSGFYGDDDQDLHIDRVICRFIGQPASANCVHTIHEHVEGVSVDSSTGADEQKGGRFDMSKEGRWHQDEISMVGAWRSTEHGVPKPQRAGRR